MRKSVNRRINKPPRTTRIFSPLSAGNYGASYLGVYRSAGEAISVGQVRTNDLIGREAELRELRELLNPVERYPRVVTITGRPGVGKSHLGRQLFDELIRLYAHGGLFLELASIHEPELLLSEITMQIGIPPLVENLVEYLYDKALLLVLDNFEHMKEARALIHQITQGAPRVKVLITSRLPLGLDDEKTYDLRPLELPDDKNISAVEAVISSACGMLLERRASEVYPTFGISQDNAPTALELCRRLEGLPLSIEIAAARVKLYPLNVLVEKIRRDFARGKKMDDVAPEERVLRATIDWSYRLLEAGEQILFRRLSVFVGSAIVEDIQHICNADYELRTDVPTALKSLCEKNMLQCEVIDGIDHFTMLDTLRQYALHQLEVNKEAGAIRKQHAYHFRAFAERADCELWGGEQAKHLKKLESVHDNLRVALKWAIEEQEAEFALKLASYLGTFWEIKGHFFEGRRWLHMALELRGEIPQIVHAKALRAAAILAYVQGENDEAKRLFEECLKIMRSCGDRQTEALLLNELARTVLYRGEILGSKHLAQEALAIAWELNNAKLQAYTHLTMGFINRNCGEYEKAHEEFELSLPYWENLGNNWYTAIILDNRGVLSMCQSAFDKAQYFLERSLALKKDLGDKRGISYSHQGLGILAQLRGDHESAASYAVRSLESWKVLGYKWGEATCLNLLGLVSCDRKEYTQAKVRFRESLELMRRESDKRNIAQSLEGLAKVAVVENYTEYAARLLGAVEALRLAIHAPLPRVAHAQFFDIRNAISIRLGEDKMRSEWQFGKEMLVDDAIEYALTQL